MYKTNIVKAALYLRIPSTRFRPHPTYPLWHYMLAIMCIYDTAAFSLYVRVYTCA